MAIKNNKTFCVYIHTNKMNGKKYIGQTCQKPERRFANGKGHKRTPIFRDAINKYGWNNFTHKIVIDGLSLEEANKLEEKLIKELKTLDREYGYNLAYGGGNRKLCESAKRKIGDFWRGKKMPQSQRDAISKATKGKNTWSKGSHHSDKTKEKMRIAHKGISPIKKAFIMSVEARRKPILCIESGRKFFSIQDASIKTGISRTAINNMLVGMSKSAGGLHWKYIEKEN